MCEAGKAVVAIMSDHSDASKYQLLNFVLLSSIVLTGKQWLCLKRFLPMSFRLTGLYLLWW